METLQGIRMKLPDGNISWSGRIYAGGKPAIALACCLALAIGCSKKEVVEGEVGQSLTQDLFMDYQVSHLVEVPPKVSEDQLKKAQEVKESEPQEKAVSLVAKLPEITDRDYLSMERFEQPVLKLVKHSPLAADTGSELSTFQEKKLIFAGSGFNTRDFEKVVDEKLNVEFHYHLVSDTRDRLPDKRVDKLDLDETDIVPNHPVVFNNPYSLMTEKQLPDPDLGAEVKVVRKTIKPAPIPETRVLLNQPPSRMLKLVSGDTAIDLLSSNEAMSRSRFYER